MMTPGQVKQTETFFAENPHLSRVLTIDTYYDFTNLDRGGFHALITSIEEAVRMGVDAVKMLSPWAHSWLALTDYAPSVWSGTPFMSDTLAARTAAWDGRTHRWVHGRVSASIGSADLLPPVRRAGDVIGHFVSSNLSVAGVIAPEAVVVAGGHDHPIGGWGVQEMDPHSLLDSMGTAEVVVAQAPSKNVAHGYHIDVAPDIQDTGTTVLSVEELARNVEWAARDTDVRRELDALIAGDRQPDDFLHRAVFLPGSRGGGRPHFTADAPRAAASRASAVLGALARLVQRAQDAVAAHLPGEPRVYAAGGWSRSRGWINAKSAVTGREVIVIPEPQVTATGAALLAAKAIGWTISPAVALGMVSAPAQRA